jgi:hypothetical protein
VPRGPAVWVMSLVSLGATAGCSHPGAAASRDPLCPPVDDTSPIDAPPGLADLQFVCAEMAPTVLVTRDVFSDASCEVLEGCVGGPGPRMLLRFDTVSANRGTADLVVGAPPPAGENSDVFEWSQCHGHHHVRDYASYELLDATGTAVLTARKQSFCLQDDEDVQPGVPPTGYSCTDQGITRGWADVYGRYLPCQWIDITAIPAGSYTLRIVVNPLHTLPESNYDNNTFTVPVTVPAAL